MLTIETYAQSRNVKHVEGVTFRCGECGEVKPIQTNGGTGYGWNDTQPDSKPICYECCGKREVASMLETGRATLYLTQPERSGPSYRLDSYGGRGHAVVTNWPGTLKLNAYVKRGAHNIARPRYDAWFTGPDGKPWHGVTYGDNTQLCHCRRVKA